MKRVMSGWFGYYRYSLTIPLMFRTKRKESEQIAKDINVRSKDEPQTEVNCDRCKHKGVYSYCHYCDGSGESFEPQTEKEGASE